MTDEFGKHRVNEENIPAVWVELKAGGQVPARVPVMALTAFTNSNCRLYFKPPGVIDEVWVPLIVIMLVRRQTIEGVSENVRDNAAEVIRLYVARQRSAADVEQRPIEKMDDPLCVIQAVSDMLKGEIKWKRNPAKMGRIDARVIRVLLRLFVGCGHESRQSYPQGDCQRFEHPNGEILASVLDGRKILVRNMGSFSKLFLGELQGFPMGSDGEPQAGFGVVH